RPDEERRPELLEPRDELLGGNGPDGDGHRGTIQERRPGERSAGNAGLVPAEDHRLLPLPAEDGDRRGREREEPAVYGREVEPTRREHAEDVTVGEQEDITGRGADVGDDAVRSRGDLLDRLAPSRAV